MGHPRGPLPYHPGDAVMVARGCGSGPAPFDWLHRLQMARPLEGVFVPPFAMARMWSGSALLGCRVMS